MSELSASAGSEGYGACPDEAYAQRRGGKAVAGRAGGAVMRLLAIFLSLLLLLSGCGTEGKEPEPFETGETHIETIQELDEIFALENDTDFAIALSSALFAWTEQGKSLDTISPEAQVFYLCNTLDEQVNSGGLVSFIFESYGQWAPETVEALENIGAPQTADILRRAIALLPGGVCPRDYVQRENILLGDKEKYYEAFSDLDDEFWAYPDGLLQDLYISYAREHRDCFSRPEI